MKRRYLKMVKMALRSLRHPHLRHRRWWQVLSRPISNRALWIPCRDTVATGLAIGMFFSMMMMPFQMVPAAVFAMRAKANVPFAMAACWITNPITMPGVIFAQYCLGKWLRETVGVPMPDFLVNVALHDIPQVGSVNAASFLLGMLMSGIICALLSFPVVHAFSAIMPHHLPVRKRKRRPTNPVDESLQP